MTMHATWYEFAYLGISTFSLATSASAWRAATLDGIYLAATGANGVRKMVADANARQEAYRLFGAVVMLFVSILFLFMAPPPPSYYEQPQALVSLVGWILLASANALYSLMDGVIRRRFRRAYDAPNPTDPTTGQPVDASKPVDNDPANAGSAGDDAMRAAATSSVEPVRVLVENTPLPVVPSERRTELDRRHEKDIPSHPSRTDITTGH